MLMFDKKENANFYFSKRRKLGHVSGTAFCCSLIQFFFFFWYHSWGLQLKEDYVCSGSVCVCVYMKQCVHSNVFNTLPSQVFLQSLVSSWWMSKRCIWRSTDFHWPFVVGRFQWPTNSCCQSVSFTATELRCFFKKIMNKMSSLGRLVGLSSFKRIASYPGTHQR